MFMSLLTEFIDLVLGPEHVTKTNWHDLFLDLHISIQQVIIEHLFRGDDGWDYLSWMVHGDEFVIHWENFDFTSTHYALIKFLASSEVIKRVTFFQG